MSPGPRRRSVPLAVIGWLGVADVAEFLWVRRHSLFRQAPGRAAGSLLGLALWAALAATSTVAPESRPARLVARVCGVGNLGLYAIHLKVGKGRTRAVPGAILGAAAILRTRH